MPLAYYLSAVSSQATASARVLGHVFSATQIDTYLDCPRKWAWGRIARIKVPSASSAQVGDRAHHQIEGYLVGKPLDFTEVVNGVRIADVVSSGLHLLPEPVGPCTKHTDCAEDPELAELCADTDRPFVVERSFEFCSPATGFLYTGRKDLSVIDGGYFPAIEGEPVVPSGAPVVSDHKTTSNLRWAKEAGDLEWDVQANLYAHEEAERADADAVDLVWTYFQTKGGKAAKRTHLRVMREDAARKFKLIEGVAGEMAAVLDRVPRLDSSPEDGGPPDLRNEWTTSREVVVMSLAPNPACCRKYGGCGFRHVCRLTPEEGMVDLMSDATEDLFDSLKKRAAAQDGGAPAPSAPAAKVNVDDLFKDAKVDSSRALVNPNGPQLQPGPPETFGDVPKNDMPINPPEADLPPPAATLPSSPTSTPETTTQAEAPRRKPGRPRKEKPAETVKEALEKVEAEEKADGRASTETLSELADTMAGFDLFVDCYPVGRSYTPAEKLFARANEIVVENTKASGDPVADFRFIGFGQAGGFLSIATMKAIEEEMPERIVLDSACDEARHVLSTLVARARTVTRGLR